MTGAHLHLILNHVPIFFCLFSVGLLIYSWRYTNAEALSGGLFMMIIAGVGAAAAYWTGIFAEKTIKNYPDIDLASIHQHENLARYGLWGMIVLGIICMPLLLFAQRRITSKFLATMPSLIIIAGISEFALLGKVAQIGGKIRHEEIRDAE